MTPLIPLVLSCGMCYLAANTVLTWINEGATKEEMVERIVTLCVTMNLQKEHICRGIAEAHADMAIWMVNKKKGTDNPITAEAVCGFALFPQCPLEGPLYTWSLDFEFTGPKPELLEEHPIPEDAPTLKVLHLTDVHVDPHYTPGSNAECDEPMCCRKDQGEVKDPKDAAGFWGDYRNCDTPMHAFKDLIKHAAKQHTNLDYVIFTGDVIDHFIWATGKQSNVETIKTVMEEMKQAFSVPILPIIGNHEAHPVNVFSGLHPEIPEELSSNWVYALAAEMWLPEMTEASKETVRKGGFYAHEIKPGLVVIAINNNYCYHLNWWLLYDNKDPTGQLQWLAEQLLEAEKAQKKVHILAHIPAGSSSCWDVWSKEYRKLIHRFENTVVAQFHGHTHYDHFNLYYDLENPSRAISAAFVGGGATAYTDVNPNYRVYTVDGVREGSTFRVLDHETWYYNLTEANLAGPDVPPNWQKLYNFKEAYGLASLHPKDLDAFVTNLVKDKDLQDKYYGYYVKLGDSSLEKGCNDKCRKSLICDIVTTVHTDDAKCKSMPFESNNALKRKKRDKEAAIRIET
ncbi:sphingomyelin phosphodiesterase-like isoform X2 [Neocloeon triangulifer]|uniref:sphingomyelin phosphodiesterase-like isoform X2 n=1 Tax=Neocloeon triangulifer TaxID=2078957 RepID=UPI00286F9748|nr:sphingomyelin phosphodiesterase-like isoform X2 [Neocloeon triangulifer]